MNRRQALLGAAALTGCAGMSETTLQRPAIIAHRGASGERPEHTMAAYRLGIEQGADFIEIDVVMTRDGVLICRHENELSGTTDVAARAMFADRRKENVVDGASVTGWWAEDFTLDEIKSLRCKERLPQLRPGSAAYDGQEAVVTFAEVLALSAQTGAGVFTELKHPTYLREKGFDPLPALIATVREAGGQRVADKLVVQAFEVGVLQTLAAMSSIRWTCTQLVSAGGGPFDRPGITYAQMLTDDGLREIAGYARGLGADNALLLPRNNDLSRAAPTDLVERAHAAGLAVHVWTLRAENFFLPPALRLGDASAPDYMRQHGDSVADARAFIALGVDGLITDFPATAVAARG